MNVSRALQSASLAADQIRFGPFELVRQTRALTRDGEVLGLGGRAFDILLALAESLDKVVVTSVLMERVWPNAVVETGGLRAHMVGLRKTLGSQDDGSPWIETLPGQGYRLVSGRKRTMPTPGPVEVGRIDEDHLPLRLVSSLGREEIVQTLVDRLTESRLVTIVGPGGIGKTTVALDAARRIAGKCRDGVRFVDLAALTDPASIPSAVAQVLGVPMLAGDPMASLIAYLRSSQMLIVLDSCELVVDAAASLAEQLLLAAPGLILLATSREPLRTRGEWLMHLGPLEVPSDAIAVGADEVGCYSATALFMARAAAAGGLRLGDNDVPILVALCRKLDGNPLAIELAAARVGMFGLRRLSSLIDERLSSLGRTRGASPARHQTLTATLDWSYRTLSEAERAILRRLSIFRSRFTVASAAAVVTFHGVDASDVLDGVESLMSKSLVAADHAGGSPKFRLLDTTRTYAAEKLSETDEGRTVAARHMAACLQLLEEAGHDLGTRTPVQWSLAHGHLIEDVGSALRWAFGVDGDAAAGIRLTAASGSLWIQLARSVEFIAHIERALGRLAGLEDARALEMALSLSLAQCHLTAGGPTPATFAAFERARALAQAEGNARYQLISLYGALCAAHMLGNHEDSLRLAEQFGAAARAAGHEQGMLMYHRTMSMVLNQVGRFDESLAHIRIVMDANPERFHFFLDSQTQIEHHGASLIHLARALWMTGEAVAAQEAARKAVEVSVAFNHPITVVCALTMAAAPIALWCGDFDSAREYIDLLASWAERHSLLFWKDAATVFAQALAWCEKEDDSPDMPEWLVDSIQVGSWADMLATFGPGLASQVALDRAMQGPQTWCAAELLRVRAEKLLAARVEDQIGSDQATGEAESLLVRSLQMSMQQNAGAWELRATVSLARLRVSEGRAAEACRLLTENLARLGVAPDAGMGHSPGKDVLAALRLLRELQATVARGG